MRFWIPVAFVSTLSAAAVGQPVQQVPDEGDYILPTAPPGEMRPYPVDSGVAANAAAAPSVVFAEVIHVDDAAWIRLYFAEVQLDDGGFVRVTSLLDGEVQELDEAALAMWGNASAYFNGDSLLVEIVAGANTDANRVRIEEIEVQLEPADGGLITNICGADDRVSSSELWTGRLLPAGCTGSVYSEDSCVVSAGHCVGGSMVLQFNVPLSNPNCSLNNPPVSEQFPLATVGLLANGSGQDWSVLSSGTNNLGETPSERYGQLRPIASAMPPVGATLTNPGYGVDTQCTFSQTQQTSDGMLTALSPTTIQHNIDTTGGSSGSAILFHDEIIGVHTHSTGNPCVNLATRVDRADFTAARDFCPPPAPTPIRTASNAGVDGYLLIAPDPYGAWAPPFSGGTGSTTDRYNPVGAGTGQIAAFTSGLQLYIGGTHRVLLSTSGDWNATLTGGNLTATITQEIVASDESGNGIDDTADSAFEVSGGGIGLALTFDLHQHVEQVTSGPAQVSVLTQEYTISNLGNDPIDFLLVRSFDGDLLWDGDFSNDNVGTGANGTQDELYVYISEAGDTATAITVSSAQGTAYCGGKHGIDPDGPGGSPAYNFGTDVQVWDSFGLPSGWQNHVAGVGYDTNGDSGASPPGSTDPRDGFIHMQIPVSLAAGPGPDSTTTVVIHHTYGHNAPVIPEEPCPWDCADDDGEVGIVDFLALLADWDNSGSCDIDGGGVGITDFLELLANWGPCP